MAVKFNIYKLYFQKLIPVDMIAFKLCIHGVQGTPLEITAPWLCSTISTSTGLRFSIDRVEQSRVCNAPPRGPDPAPDAAT